MIILKPSKQLKKETQIDFNALNLILRSIFTSKKENIINVYKSRPGQHYSSYNNHTKTIRIFYKDSSSLNYLIGTIIHEIRHYMQLSQSKIRSKLTFDYTSYKKYYSSPEEKDARDFERLTKYVCRSYRNFVILKEEFRKRNFKSLEKVATEIIQNEHI